MFSHSHFINATSNTEMNTTLFSTAQLNKCKVAKPKAQPKVYTLTDVLLFGKYQKQMLRAIAIQDPEYLLYIKTQYKLQYSIELLTFIQQMQLYSK